LFGAREDGPAPGFGVEGVAVLLDGREVLGVVVAEDVELLAGPVERAREQEQLEQEEARRVVGGLRLDFGDLGVDGLSQLSLTEQFAGGHAKASEAEEGRVAGPGWGADQTLVFS
jgi:hypothetical protein